MAGSLVVLFAVILSMEAEPDKRAGSVSNTVRSTLWNGEHALRFPFLSRSFLLLSRVVEKESMGDRCRANVCGVLERAFFAEDRAVSLSTEGPPRIPSGGSYLIWGELRRRAILRRPYTVQASSWTQNTLVLLPRTTEWPI